jgi:molecular chaperone GrpE
MPERERTERPEAVEAEERQEAGEDQESSPVEALEHDIDELLAKANERDEYLSLAQRTQADFENYRKRAAKEMAAAEDRGMARLARELLPALDNLSRALEATDADDEFVAGIRLVHSELQAALASIDNA